jgi:hypothetical protein
MPLWRKVYHAPPFFPSLIYSWSHHSFSSAAASINSIEELMRRPLPPGKTERDVVEEAKVMIMYLPADLPRQVAKAAVKALNDEHVLNATFR